MFHRNSLEHQEIKLTDQRLPGKIWSDRVSNLIASADAAGVVSRDHARLANETPENFQLIMAEKAEAERARQQAEHAGEIATERLVAHR